MKTPEASKEFIDYCIKNYCDPDSLIDTNSKSLVFMGKFEWLYYKILAIEKELDELKRKWTDSENARQKSINDNLDISVELQTLKDAVKEKIKVESDMYASVFKNDKERHEAERIVLKAEDKLKELITYKSLIS